MKRKTYVQEHRVEEKIVIKDHEAGTGAGWDMTMREIEVGLLLIGGRKYRVGKDVFARCVVGDRVRVERKIKNDDLVKMEIFLDGSWMAF